MKIGYARISTTDQKMHLQIDALEKSGCEKIFQESASGSDAERTELEDAISETSSGDIFVVWKLDRLGRSLRDIIDFVERLSEKNVGFQSITDGIDTSSTPKTFKSALSLYKANDLSIREICMSLNINSRTLSRYIAKYKINHPGELE